MKASVIVPTFGERPAYLGDLITSLAAQDLPSRDFEILVIDNSPGGQMAGTVAELKPHIPCSLRYIVEGRTGLHYARHTGARRAASEVLVYIDDDVLVPEHWLRTLVSVFDDEKVTCAGGPALPQWEGERPDWQNQFDSGYLSLLDLGDARRELQYPECVWGCNMAVRRSSLYAVGGFNPDGIGVRRLIWLRGDGECGLQHKLNDAGLRIVYEPAAWLYHRIPASRLTPKSFYRRFFIQGVQDSYVRFRERDTAPGGVLMYATYCALQMLRFYVTSLVQRSRTHHLRALAWRYYGRAAHHVRLFFLPDLRRHVKRASYLDPPDLATGQ